MRNERIVPLITDSIHYRSRQRKDMEGPILQEREESLWQCMQANAPFVMLAVTMQWCLRVGSPGGHSLAWQVLLWGLRCQ